MSSGPRGPMFTFINLQPQLILRFVVVCFWCKVKERNACWLQGYHENSLQTWDDKIAEINRPVVDIVIASMINVSIKKVCTRNMTVSNQFDRVLFMVI